MAEADAANPQATPGPESPQPTPNTGTRGKNDRVIDAMSTLLSNGVTIGAFFAGFTLNIVASVNPNEIPHVRLYAAICSLLFVLLVLLSAASSVIFAFYKEDFVSILNGRADKNLREKWTDKHMWVVFGLLPSFLFTILTGGVYFFFLTMKGYEDAVALAGLAIIGMGTVCGGIGWLSLLLSYVPHNE